MPLGEADSCKPKELHGNQYRTNPFAAARCDKTAMRPLAKLLTLVTTTTTTILLL